MGCNIKKTRGFTLIEVLISVLVLAVGLLGFAALQITAVNNNQESYFRTQATVIAQDMASRMHTNRDYINWDTRATPQPTAKGAIGDLNAYVTPSPVSSGFSCTSPPPKICVGNTAANTCDQQEMAQFDTWQECNTASQVLPGGLVHVSCTDKPAELISGVVNPRVNPFSSSNLYFKTTPALLTGTDTDSCSPGSHFSIYVSWLKTQTRTDKGEAKLNSNQRCKTDIGLPDTRDCVVIDMVP